MERSEDWFKERIGKRIYRTITSCNCLTCKRVYVEGLTIQDKDHAWYLLMHSYDESENPDGSHYFDTEKERDDFERENNA